MYLDDLKLTSSVQEVLKGTRSHILIKSTNDAENLPDTPYRGSMPMYKMDIPKQSFLIDQKILRIASLLGSKSIRIQSNIDSFTEELWSPALNFHFDRGALITILGALKGASNKHTVLITIDAIIKKVKDPILIEMLCQPIFSFNQQDQLKKSVPFLTRMPDETYRISFDIIRYGLELKDIYVSSDRGIGLEALGKLRKAIEDWNNILITQKTNDSKEIESTSICLNNGDILIINNSMLFHGRTAGKVLDIKSNRWLRAMFLGDLIF